MAPPHHRNHQSHYCAIPGLFADAERGASHGQLHIYLPAEANDAPVIAYVHGGRFESGGPQVDASALTSAGFVVVSIGYRLGLAGFAQFHDDAPAHYRGIADVQLALEWVQKNIEFYGGDPTNVTLVGQSAGAAIALWLARRDHYRGAFRRLVALSPGFPSGGFRTRRHTLRAFLGAPITRQSLDRMANKHPARLRRAYRRFRAFYFDGPALGPHPWASAELADVPILVSCTREEFYNEPVSARLDAARLGGVAAQLLRRRFGVVGSLRGYFRGAGGGGVDKQAGTQAQRFVSDAVIRRWVSEVAEHDFSPESAGVWVAELVGPDGPALHCDDLGLLFSGRGALFADVCAFARGHTPSWPRFSQGRACRRWGADGSAGIVADPLRAVRELFSTGGGG